MIFKNKQKNKKGFAIAITGLIFSLLMVVLLGLLIFAGIRLEDSISKIVSLLTKYWWVIPITVAVVIFRQQLKAILNFLLGKLGVKV